MNTFTDATGRAWQLDSTRVPPRKQRWLLAGNQSDLRELLYEICREQCESLGMTRSEFFQAADGAAVEWTVALLNELESHLDSQQLRKLKSALNRQQAALTSFAKERAKFRRRRSALEARIG